MGMLGNKALELFKEAMEDYGIEPGELNENIQNAMEVVDRLEPILKNIDDRAERLESDTGELMEEVEQFNDNSREMVRAFDECAKSFEKVADAMEDLEEMED